jgi:hypothetical protein
VPIQIKTTGFEQYMNTGRSGSYVKTLIMGEHGVGKTPSAASWPKPIIADCENGLASVASRGIPYVEIHTSSDMQALVEELRRDSMKPPEQRRFLTLVIDTIDSYQRRLIQQRLRSEQKESMSGWADWGWLDGKMTQLVEGLLSLPMNVVVNMHVKDAEDGDEDSRMLVKKARLKGDFKDAIYQDFDLIGLMESSYVPGTGDKQGERVQVRNIRWHAEPRFPALRDRFNKLPRFTAVDFTEDDYYRIFNAITADLDSIPETEVIDEIETEAVTEPAPADVKGGPVEAPKLPRPPAAKKAAKKAPAKKTAAAKKTEDKVTIDYGPDETAVPTDAEADAWAEGLVKNELGGVVIAEEPPAIEIPTVEVEPEQPASPRPPTAAPAQKAAKHCGDQPASMTRFDPAPGCGQVLTPENADRAQVAVIKAKTYLCNDCHDKFLANA